VYTFTDPSFDQGLLHQCERMYGSAAAGFVSVSHLVQATRRAENSHSKEDHSRDKSSVGESAVIRTVAIAPWLGLDVRALRRPM
jgi:hypothetical protein